MTSLISSAEKSDDDVSMFESLTICVKKKNN